MVRQTIYLSMVSDLRDAIRRGDYAKKSFPSEAQLMRKYKIGRQTSVRVLNELVREGLVVRRKGAGTFLSCAGQRATGRIGLIVHGSDYCELFAPVAKHVSLLCQQNGYTMMFGDVSSQCTSKRIRKVLALADKFIADGLDGVIFQPVELVPDAERVNRDLTSRFAAAGIPVVLLDSDIVSAPARSGFDIVSVSHLDVGRRLAEHLRSVGAGRVLYLTQRDRAPCVRARQLGVKLGCEGLALAGKAVFAEPDDVPALRRILRRERPDAIACYNDRQAALLLQTLAKLGKRVPDDVLVAGFDDVQYAKLTIPQLTTMHQPCTEIASEAFRLLLDRIRNQQLPPRQVLLDAPLVVRGSTIKQKE